MSLAWQQAHRIGGAEAQAGQRAPARRFTTTRFSSPEAGAARPQAKGQRLALSNVQRIDQHLLAAEAGPRHGERALVTAVRGLPSYCLMVQVQQSLGSLTCARADCAAKMRDATRNGAPKESENRREPYLIAGSCSTRWCVTSK